MVPCSATDKRHWRRWGMLGVGSLITTLLAVLALRLLMATTIPPEAMLVLGGSIRREMHAVEQVLIYPERPVLISSGSADPCIRLLFERQQAPIHQVWLEHCARSTFDNFYYGLPLLLSWQVHHISLITSDSHLPRAVWLARIILGAHGIWITPDIVVEQGHPGNAETPLKTFLDLLRGSGWALISQVYRPHCPAVIPLADVDLARWQQTGFKCEYQGGLQDFDF